MAGGITYLGNRGLYGSYEMQQVTPNGITSEWPLNFKVGTPNQLLVVWDGVIQTPGPGNAFTITNGGDKILFSFVPDFGTDLFWIFLGVQLTVGRVQGIEPKYETFTGDGSTQNFTLASGPVNIDSVIVFVNRIQQRPTVDFLLSANEIQFITAPNIGDVIDCYIHGVERTDISNALSRSGNDFSTFPNKSNPVGNDIVLIEDSQDSNNKKKVLIANLPGGGGASLVDNEIPTGIIDNINMIFTLTQSYVPGSVKLYYNGFRLTPGISNDFFESGTNIITMNFAPQTGDMLLCDYRV